MCPRKWLKCGGMARGGDSGCRWRANRVRSDDPGDGKDRAGVARGPRRALRVRCGGAARAPGDLPRGPRPARRRETRPHLSRHTARARRRASRARCRSQCRPGSGGACRRPTRCGPLAPTPSHVEELTVVGAEPGRQSRRDRIRVGLVDNVRVVHGVRSTGPVATGLHPRIRPERHQGSFIR